jgi:hypothetical protein
MAVLEDDDLSKGASHRLAPAKGHLRQEKTSLDEKSPQSLKSHTGGGLGSITFRFSYKL